MQIKKFEATTIQEALENVKKELGPEAIILKTKRNKAGFGLLSGSSVEVTAAVPDKAIERKKIIDTRLTEKSKEEIKNLSAQKQSKIYDQVIDKVLMKKAIDTKDKIQLSGKKYIDISDDKIEPKKSSSSMFFGASAYFSKPEILQKNVEIKKDETLRLEKEIENLRNLIQDMKAQNISVEENVQPQAFHSGYVFSTPETKDFFSQLIINGMDQKLAYHIIKRVEELLTDQDKENPERILEELALKIMENTEVLSLLEGIVPESSSGPVKIALVGPTGVGKTTTIAKIAGEALLKKKLKVGIINLDFVKAGAYEQLKTYSQIFNLPFHSVSDKKGLELAIEDLSSMDLILVDTAGYAQNDELSLIRLEEILGSVINLRAHLVLSSSTRDLELYSIGKKFSILKPEGIIFSKLDESLSFGAIYNVSQKLKLPVTYFTDGQKVPDDIQIATKEKMASLILDL